MKYEVKITYVPTANTVRCAVADSTTWSSRMALVTAAAIRMGTPSQSVGWRLRRESVGPSGARVNEGGAAT